jgi:uncharacterized coiled-coil DUF342 family protein
MANKLTSKKFPITVIGTVIVTISGFIWSAALVWDKFEKYDTRIAELETEVHSEYVYDDAWVHDKVAEIISNLEVVTVRQEDNDPAELTRQITAVLESIDTLRRDIDNVHEPYDDSDMRAEVERLIAHVETLQDIDVTGIMSALSALEVQMENLGEDLDDVEASSSNDNPLSL